MSEVSIVIVTYNSANDIRQCLTSLGEGERGGAHEVIVVDNASTDGTPDLVESEFPSVKLLRPMENLGYSGGNNRGVSAASGEFILLLNPDTVVLAGAIEMLAETLRDDEGVWVTGPCILDAERRIAHSFGDLPNLWWALTDYGPLRRFGFRSNRVVVRFGGCDKDRDVGFITGASMMTTREAWDRLGGLDEDYFLYYEDVDFCARTQRNGGRCRLTSTARVIHMEGASFGAAQSARFLRSLQGLVLYLAKNVSPVAAQLFRSTAIAEYAAYVSASYLPGRLFAGIRTNRAYHTSAIRALASKGLTKRSPRTL